MQVMILLNFLMNSATIYGLTESLLEEVWTQVEKCHATPSTKLFEITYDGEEGTCNFDIILDVMLGDLVIA